MHQMHLRETKVIIDQGLEKEKKNKWNLFQLVQEIFYEINTQVDEHSQVTKP